MKPIKLIVKTDSKKYPIIIGSNLISNLPKILQNNAIQFNKCFFVIDKNIPKKIVAQLKKKFKKNSHLYFLKASEKNKNQKTIDNILELLLRKNFSRTDCLIAVGGGITGDVGGFASSVFKRGLKFINIPTTLLAQVDSSVGGKTGVNSKYGKNLIGSFYQPELVISDVTLLKSLPKREIVCGYGEILKHSLIANEKFYKFLNLNVLKILALESPFIEKAIYESCKIKKSVVEKDEKEKNYRKILNFGHTFAHSYEAALNYSKKLNHGEAVILGINSALKFSLNKKLLTINSYKSIIDHILKSKLPNNIKTYFSLKHLNRILFFMLKDKKNKNEKINLILLKKIGSPVINNNYNVKTLKNFFKQELID